MKELADIVTVYKELNRTGKSFALATVVGVTGSTYRRPGARMLFSEEGRQAGLINAACLESDLSERARKIIASGKSELIAYDTTSPEDIVFGLGLGCNGTVEILMESSQSPSVTEKMEIFKRSLSADCPIVLATVVDANAISGLQPGDYVVDDNRGSVNGSIGNAGFSGTIASECRSFKEIPFAQKSLPLAGGQVRVFFETLSPPLPLVVFGAGPDAIPLVASAKSLGWNVTVVDHRPAFATKSNVRSADAVVLSEPERLADHLKLSPRHVAVIMTHNFDKDRKLLKYLLSSEVRYVGLLGPKTKLQTLLQNLEADGFVPTELQLAKLYAPIGLDIGAETPEEIAYSIIAEIKAVLQGRSGGFLKDRKGAIH